MDMPIALTVGHVTVNVREVFVIQLDVDRRVPKTVMDTVLGTGDPVSPEPVEAHGFKLAWTVSSDGTALKRAISDGHNQGYWGSTTIFIVHCNQDPVLPFQFGQEVYNAARPPKHFLEINGYCHEEASVIAPVQYQSALRKFLANIEKTGRNN